MKRLVLLLLSAFVVVAAASAEPFVIIVRHAEKAASGGSDPDLAPAGRARADALARMLKDSVTTIFASEFKRTQETAAPTAKSAGVVPTIVPAKISRRSFRNYIS
jgi:broad specificity phosphatase PhoE